MVYGKHTMTMAMAWLGSFTAAVDASGKYDMSIADAAEIMGVDTEEAETRLRSMAKRGSAHMRAVRDDQGKFVEFRFEVKPVSKISEKLSERE